ncbi:uncharacterized protein [Antedon mediterranea]|uniref:uncharacterized protein isoform X2 n=1 Tax=Antedon mediterranea TaxID=105859 RepID=UPI003AF4F972
MCFISCAMNAFILESFLATSLSINIFVAMYCGSKVFLTSARFTDRCPPSLGRLHEECPWYLPRYVVLTLGNILLFLLGIVTLCATNVIQSPFRDIPRTVQIGFAIMVGFYIFKLTLDSIHYIHIPSYGIPTVHHILTITLYLVFLVERQNGLCGVLGLVFQADAVFIDFSKLLNQMDKEDHELSNITWMNNLVFFSIWNLLMFRNAAVGCFRYHYKLKEMACQRALIGLSSRVTGQQLRRTQAATPRLIMEHNNLKRLPPRSNTNIATKHKEIDRPNNLKVPKLPIREAIGLEPFQTTDRPSHSRHADTSAHGLSTFIDFNSDYNVPHTNSEIDEHFRKHDGRYRCLDGISCSTSDSSSYNAVVGTESSHVMPVTPSYVNSVVDNTGLHFHRPYNYLQIDGDDVRTDRPREQPRQTDSTINAAAMTTTGDRSASASCLTESEAALTAQLAQTNFKDKPITINEQNNNRPTAIFQGINVPNNNTQSVIPGGVCAYRQFGERQSI